MTKQLIDDPFFEDEDFQRAFSGYDEMRKKIKKPMTHYAMELVMKKLHDYSKDNVKTAIAILEQSIEGSWQGVFRLREDDRFNPTRQRSEM